MSRKANFAQDKLMHSLIHSHIGELINHIDLNYGIDSDILWRILASAIRDHLESIAKDKFFDKQAKEDLDYFFKNVTNIKSLLKMKLGRQAKRYIYTVTKNPLVLTK